MEDVMDIATLRAEVDGKYDYIRYIFTDIPGTCRHKLIPARNAVQGTSVYSGVAACGPLTEMYVPKMVEEGNFPNATLQPMSETLRPAPWISKKHRTAMVICESFWMDGKIQEATPRTVARRQLARLSDMGYSLLSAFEEEFTVMSHDTHQPVFPTPDYCETLSLKPFEELFMDLDQHMVAARVDLEAFHTEHGPGKFETVLRPAFGIEAADQAFILKNTVKEMFLDKELLANYMAKPVLEESASGCGTHLNFSLWDKMSMSNAFYSKDGLDVLSDIGHWWLGGLIHHADALCALVNPTVNCYRRLHEPLSPDYNDWNVDDRTVCYRIKNSNPTDTYFENRLPSALCNPYITLAATVAAGLDGINKKIEPPPKGRVGSHRLPNTLPEALDALENDGALCESLGQEFVEWFLGNKREVDMKVLGYSDQRESNNLAAEYHEYARLC